MSLATALGFRINETQHEKQRSPNNIGDWIPGKPIEIRISAMRDRRHVELVAVHEIAEYMLCKLLRRSDEKAIAFDINYKGEFKEPGDDPRAPYHAEHVMATFVERIWARIRGVSWSDYSNEVDEIVSSQVRIN